MNQRELFETWAPPSSIWSPWAKPVLFAHLTPSDLQVAAAMPPLHHDPDCSWTSAVGPETAVILDMPGAESVTLAAAMAHRGFRPVPLFNTTPGPPPVLVSVREILGALAFLAEKVRSARLHIDAPPVFMLDSLRLEGARVEGAYDNRWAVFEQDFPSSTFMMSHGITQLLLVAPHGGTSPDLARILSGWRRDGLSLLVRAAHGTSKIEPLTPRRMLNWRLAAFAAMLALGLRRNATGGFGSRVPVSSSGGGGLG
jgi:hypothetical protein